MGSIVHEVETSSPQTPNKGVEIISTPYNGMVFDTTEVAREYYTQFGRQNGFSVRCRSSQARNRNDNKKSTYVLVCGRQGMPIPLSKPRQRNTSTGRCGCKAQMRLARIEENQWVVRLFDDNHNHKMVTPAKRMRMKVNRLMPKTARSLSEKFEDENLPVGKVVVVLDGDKVGFNERDCYNHLNATRKYKTPKVGDAIAASNYFQKKKAEDPNFFYNIQVDYESRAVNFFWVDGRSRSQYVHFGDVVCFDTTYKKNAYQMPFGPFTGVNHHLQSIQFGCALLLDETEESFIWLFETWLAAMGGRAPISIITDQDKAMTKAIAKVFPNAQHRFCYWHIMKKFPTKLAHIYHQKPSFKKEFHKCIQETYRVADFEEQWNEILVKHDLVEHQWLKKMYDIRDKWVPVYHLKTFYAGMNTTGRSEGMNSFYKDYFSHTTQLREFVYKNEKCLERMARREKDSDYDTEHKDRIVDGYHCILKHAAKIYTISVYDKFKDEFVKAQVEFKIQIENQINDCHSYSIISRNDEVQYVWKVTFNLRTFEGCCECKLYEFLGIPCGHLLKVFLRHDLDEIPEKFILRRWLQKANKYRVRDGSDLVSGTKDSDLLKLLRGSQLANQVVYEASEDNATFQMLVETLTDLSERIAKHKEARKEHMTDSVLQSNKVIEEPANDVSQQVLLDPNISKTKGRKENDKSSANSRWKSGIETSTKKKERKCTTCLGTGHDKRTCPQNPKRNNNNLMSMDMSGSLGQNTSND